MSELNQNEGGGRCIFSKIQAGYFLSVNCIENCNKNKSHLNFFPLFKTAFANFEAMKSDRVKTFFRY
jgi:hypothetical protein